MEIRRATEGDLPALIDLYDQLYRLLAESYRYPFTLSRADNAAALSLQLRSRLCAIFVAAEEGTVRGFVHASVFRLEKRLRYQGDSPLIGRIDDLCVAADYRGRGLGKALLRTAEDWLRSQEVCFAESYVLPENRPSLSFHAQNGYAPAAHRLLKKL